MFTPFDREKILQQILAGLEPDHRILSVVLVGSGAIGFNDEFSDIDLVAVVDPQYPATDIFQDWVQRLRDDQPVIEWFEISFNADNHLAGFLLDGCLEIDFGVVTPGELVAKRPHWRVVYDRSGKVNAQLQWSWVSHQTAGVLETVEQYRRSTWHYITQTAFSVQRGQLWRAMHNLEEVRNRTIRLAGLRYGLETSHFREVDKLPEDIRVRLATTLVQNATAAEIMRALKQTVALFFQEIRTITRVEDKTAVNPALENVINTLLDEFEENLQT